MEAFRPGDVRSPHGTLRLSVGALADMAGRLDAPGPAALAARLRRMDEPTARHMLVTMLLRRDAQACVDALTAEQVAAVVPDITRTVVEALR